jgi:hypothetical protein
MKPKTWSMIAGAAVGLVFIGPRGLLVGAKVAHDLHEKLVSSAANDNDDEDEEEDDDEFQGDVIEGEAIEE